MKLIMSLEGPWNVGIKAVLWDQMDLGFNMACQISKCTNCMSLGNLLNL